MARAKFCVFVGRFQPFHNAHLKVLLRALDEAETVLVVIGSDRAPRTIKNPWSYEERAAMVHNAVPPELHARIKILPLRDFVYNDIAWVTSLQNVVSRAVGDKNGFHSKIIGCFKDDSSYYLQLFPQWELVRENYHDGLDATEIRKFMFEGNYAAVQKLVPSTVYDFLVDYMETAYFAELQREYRFIESYRARWADAPYPPTFVTTDAVVVKAGHVLLVKRGINPGKGKFALPGGFVNQNEQIYNAAIRELKEETKILIPVDELHAAHAGQHVFDHPQRDLRGRTITHAQFFKLPIGGPLPQVEGGDDANEALWMPLGELALHEENFYSDHLHIINYFVSVA